MTSEGGRERGLIRPSEGEGLPIGEDAARGWIEENLSPTVQQWQQLESFVSFLLAANERQNLISASSVPILWHRHILDSAQLLRFDTRHGLRLWLDLGSGAGFPALVAAILTERPYNLVEPRKLRCDFLRESTELLGLTNRVSISQKRLEVLSPVCAATISARAFAPLGRLISLSAAFSTQETRWLLPKGKNARKELALIPQTWQRLFRVEQSLTDADSLILIGRGTVRKPRMR